MRIIISPAKQMRVDTDSFACKELPVFMDRTEVLMKWIQSLSYEEQKKLWVCNDKIARQNAERFAHMDLHKNLTPALLAYDGIQYTYMAPAVFEDGQYDYVQEHLRILSGFYGVVRPMDGVIPYRLEMQAKAAVAGYRNLYDFWGDDLYREVMDDSRVLINLASKDSQRIAILPVYSASSKVERSFRRAFMQKWPEARWYVSWPASMSMNRSRLKLSTGAAIILMRADHLIRNMSLFGQIFLERNESLEIMAL